MRTGTRKLGLTLVEILVAVGIIAILLSMVIGVMTRTDVKNKERLAEETLAIVNAALTQFADYEYQYRPNVSGNELEFYRSLRFPLDCNGFDKDKLDKAIEQGLGRTDVAILNAGDHSDLDSGCEAMYFFLMQVPACRNTLDRIDQSFLRNRPGDAKTGQPMEVRIGEERSYPLMRIVDPWGRTLRYDYYVNGEEDGARSFRSRKDTIRNFPLVTSAGPDKTFGTSDDIFNREETVPQE